MRNIKLFKNICSSLHNVQVAITAHYYSNEWIHAKRIEEQRKTKKMFSQRRSGAKFLRSAFAPLREIISPTHLSTEAALFLLPWYCISLQSACHTHQTSFAALPLIEL